MRFFYLFIMVIFSLSFSYDLSGKKYVDFYGRDESGNVLKLSDLAQRGKPVVVVFWAIGDVDTYRTLPKLNRLYEKYKIR